VREIPAQASGTTLSTRLAPAWRRLGPVLTTLAALVVLMPAWIGFNGLELGGASLNLLDDEAFRIEPEGAKATLGDFVYFSIMSQLTLDNGKLSVFSKAAKLAIVTHGLLTVGWNLLFFAAMTAYVQRFWARIDSDEPTSEHVGSGSADSPASDVEARLARLESLVAAEQALASSRHQELLLELRDGETR
jgi:hypothetical protein